MGGSFCGFLKRLEKKIAISSHGILLVKPDFFGVLQGPTHGEGVIDISFVGSKEFDLLVPQSLEADVEVGYVGWHLIGSGGGKIRHIELPCRGW